MSKRNTFKLISSDLKFSNPADIIGQRQTGDDWPEAQLWVGKPINVYADNGDAEKLADLGLEVYVSPPPDPPTLEEHKIGLISRNQSEAGFIILSAYPDFVQMNFADGTYVDGKDLYLTEKASVIAEENRVADLINTATTIAKVDAAQATLNFPTIGGA